MIDRGLIAKKLAALEARIHELRGRLRPEAVIADPEHRGYVERSLQVIVQTAMDIAAVLVSSAKLGEPRRNRDLFELLSQQRYLPAELVPNLVRMVGFRNILVHGYEIVDPHIVRDVAEHRLADIETFIVAMRSAMGRADP